MISCKEIDNYLYIKRVSKKIIPLQKRLFRSQFVQHKYDTFVIGRGNVLGFRSYHTSKFYRDVYILCLKVNFHTNGYKKDSHVVFPNFFFTFFLD